MDKELTKKLQEKYPTFFRDLYGDPAKTCMAFGIECSDGWYNLIEKVCEDIAATNPPEEFRFAQIKEKFGELRIYADHGTEAIYKLLDAAERESGKVCESCGSRENVTTVGPGWIRTLCQSCRDKR